MVDPADHLLPPGETPRTGSSPIAPAVPSKKQQQWGVVISIVIIVMMIVVGAFYAWGKRISEQYPPGLLETSE